MSSRTAFLACLTIAVVIAGCGTTSDAMPEAEHSRVYRVSYEQVWEAAVAALGDRGMSLVDRRRADGVLKGGTGFSMCDSQGLEITVMLTDRADEGVRVDARAAARGAKIGAAPCATNLVRDYLAALDVRVRPNL